MAAKLLQRNYIGIDKSLEAVALSEERISNPIKTESNLLKNGRSSYVNADKDALGILAGIPLIPVQRNKGIDAILVKQFENSPVLVRVQKLGETLSEAVSHLLKAKKTKQSKRVVLIQTQNNDLFEENPIHEGLLIIQSPGLQIENSIEKELTNSSKRTKPSSHAIC